MSDHLSALWDRAMTALQAEARRHGHTLSDDDRGMSTADAYSLLLWTDDLESRVGYSVGDFRACILDYCMVRDGAQCPEEAQHVADVLAELDAQASG
jgi:hypothetical protein